MRAQTLQNRVRMQDVREPHQISAANSGHVVSDTVSSGASIRHERSTSANYAHNPLQPRRCAQLSVQAAALLVPVLVQVRLHKRAAPGSACSLPALLPIARTAAASRSDGLAASWACCSAVSHLVAAPLRAWHTGPAHPAGGLGSPARPRGSPVMSLPGAIDIMTTAAAAGTHPPMHHSLTACSVAAAFLARQRRARVLGPDQRIKQSILLVSR